MSYYFLADTIQPCEGNELFTRTGSQYVAVLTTPEWVRDRDRFDMGIELEIDTRDIHNTKAEVNYDSLTGTFRIPDRENIGSKDYCFAFALD
jgi:magnesium transporter